MIHHLAKLAWFAAFILAAPLASSSYALTPATWGDGVTDDATIINNALTMAAGSCETVRLQCTGANTFIVKSTINVPKCVRLVGECGAVPDEGSNSTVGTTLRWAGHPSLPVVAFHDSPGASLSGVSVDCGPAPAGVIGIQYNSDNNPSGSFVRIDNLMIRGCHQGLVVGLADNTTVSSCPFPPAVPSVGGCAQADQLKFERFRILGNLIDLSGEGIHINSANAAQGSLIFDGNIQGVNIGIHMIQTNGGLIVQGTNYGSQVGTTPAFIVIESTVASSPTLINDEVEGIGAAVVDHGCNGTPGIPVWLNNIWNDHAVTVDGNENITSIGNVLNTNATLTNSARCAASTPSTPSTPHVLSVNEQAWMLSGTVTSANQTVIGPGTAIFGPSLIDQDVIEAAGLSCNTSGKPVPTGTNILFPIGVNPGDLVACEAPHLGRLYLGQDLMLLNNGDGSFLETAAPLMIQKGLYVDGTGLKHQTASIGPIPAGSAAQVTLTWFTAFVDANYQAICAVQDNSQSLQLMSTSVPTTGQLTAEVKNTDASNSHTGVLACIAIHN